MYKRIIVLGIAIVATFLSTAPALASSGFPWREEVNKQQCGAVGSSLVDIDQNVINDADSGEAGNYWAFDRYHRAIKVFATAVPNTYCAIVKYDGFYDGQAGQTSPGNTGTLTGVEDEAFAGGYRAIITGALLADPAWKKYGKVGTTDYQCDLSGNCPGRVDWVAQYFEPTYGFSYGWWGWIYYGRGNRGNWINSVDGNSGDIL